MPNHVKNVIRFGFNVPQERIDLLFKHVLSTPPIEEGVDASSPAQFRFDFNTLIPMPASLDIECGSRMDEGILLYRILLDMNALGSSAADRVLSAKFCGDVFSKPNLDAVASEYKQLMRQLHPDVCQDSRATEAAAKLNHLYDEAKMLLRIGSLWTGSHNSSPLFHFPDVKSYIVEHLERDMAAAGFDFSDRSSFARYAATNEGKLLYTLGETAYNNEKNYGFTSWYDWSCEYWGTKWNSYDNSIDRERRTITFSTAWSRPTPIIKALASMFPDVDFVWEYADEDCGYNTGRYVHEDGALSCVEFDGGSDAGYQMYVSCWGADDCMYQNENGAWRRYDCDDCPHKCYPNDCF